ncbi:MAG: CARDB domain-containing protein, partial [Dehalococcoidia bacterium]
MKIKTILTAILLPALTIITISTACRPATLPARFEVTYLEISPKEINKGETADVSVKVMNTGGTSSIYGVNLYVDDKKVSTKLINLAPGYTQSVVFSLSVDEAGAHKISVGEKSGTLTVISKSVLKQVEIAYD